MWTVISILLLTGAFVSGTPNCIKRDFPAGSVCICNSTHCDDIEPLDKFIGPGTAIIYRSDSKGARMDKAIVKQSSNPVPLTLEIDPSTVYQEIIGFGGALTDAVGVNLASLTKATQESLIKQYYGTSGKKRT
ncbi:hypothetical protein PMAYCL1PPCAC_21032 [Pristionchus mayeri]|uniref:Glucosylceramidase n=1 Tax=Pristionchus mayeri TaxID=1317129 RepID=A0AAN5CUH5_9BILA|nr:hypothetical protein PMAYCL1PPCAC_21032 [Pristionchus mayeri]